MRSATGQGVLHHFNDLDDLTDRVASSEQFTGPVKSSQLALGPLAELLVLRRAWRSQGRKVAFDGAGDARHAAIRAVTSRNSLSAHLGPQAGALRVLGSSEASELANHEFAVTAGRVAQDAGMPDAAARLLKGAFAELIGNIGEHAGDDANGLAAYHLDQKSMWLAVADGGNGVVSGYVSSSPDLAGLEAAKALEWAVVEHRSRLSESGRGTGFSTVMRAMRTLDAALRVRSDDASIEIEGSLSDSGWVVRDQDVLKGFVVSLHVSWQ